MSLTMNATEEMADAANYPNFKLFTVPLATAATEQKDTNITKHPGQGKWLTASPTTIKNFSAVCFMAVREIARLHTKKRPMGLIFSAWGGTRIEAWMSKNALGKCAPEFPVPALTKKSPQNEASALWNAMAAPFAPVAVRTALWYQVRDCCRA
jgi:hypothetical protein